jgi:hypothetical protein
MAKNQNPSSDEIKTVIKEAEKLTGFKSDDEPTVPAQTTPENSAEEQDSGVDMEGSDKMIPEAVEPKKSFGERLKPLGEKLKKNRKGIILTLAVFGAATVAVAKFAAKTVVEEAVEVEKISEMSDEELAKVEGIEDVEEAKKNA